ncbi:adenylate/guanylate cyclase domain-containing protein [Microvirga sp. SYSU G3D207]|uniref:Adenylate/guanylate cyclase domain-containing protein n=2 Tax=Microvirga arsenatis TaxID=2692265 RepID=A0ABW9YVV6_9HYPH|nr:adenylate/guanylate cyclase domain-containing protein [Microvirga arsenatis]NBJ23957.1 adenylate/guanylate cyclase domain-containing protein [Microvirga arsenatis]
MIPPPSPPVPDDLLTMARSLDAESLSRVIALRDWLVTVAARMEDANEVLSGFLDRLIEVGLPIDRAVSAIEALHSEYAGIGRFWTREEGTVVRYLPHGDRREAVYQTSPFAHVNRTGQWLILDLASTPDDLFPVIPELKEAGYRQYVTIPIRFTNGAENAISFATRTPGGFGQRELTILRMVMPSFALVTELRATSNRLDEVLRIYVGDDPHKAILSGAIQRGQVTRIRSAILFADMRDYTHISATLSPESAVELLNNYFDCLVPPIEDEGGEVLKYLGDGLLAIMRDKGDDTGGAAQSALTAATKALRRIESANSEGRFPVPIHVGFALHHGDAAYGNVGSGQRLDFTVIGRDVNLASRIADLNKRLGEPLLMSKPFVEHLWGDPMPLGAHAVEGFAEAIEVYKP